MVLVFGNLLNNFTDRTTELCKYNYTDLATQHCPPNYELSASNYFDSLS